MGEVWKDIEGFEGFYQVSNTGYVRSLPRKVEQSSPYGAYERSFHGFILKPKDNGNGYFTVTLGRPGIKRRQRHYVHRLVALYFVPNLLNKPQVNHLDGKKGNNAASNLEWVTSSENHIHAVKLGIAHRARGERAAKSKLTEEQVKWVLENCVKNHPTLNPKAISQQLGVHYHSILDILNGKHWKHMQSYGVTTRRKP